MSTALVEQKFANPEVTSETIESFTNWVLNIALPEQLAWESDSFKEMREYLKAHKAAKNLRIQAVKLECIALRRVQIAGFARKLKPTDRKVAEWLGQMTDAEFAQLIEDSENLISPYSLMNGVRLQEDSLSNWFGSGFKESVSDEAGISQMSYSGLGISDYVTAILESVIKSEDSFSVNDVSYQLYSELNKDRVASHEDEIPREFAGEPLREVIRKALRSPGIAEEIFVGDRSVRIPAFVTYQPDDGDFWKRIPWGKATINQLLAMVKLREAQAAQLENAASNMRVLYELLAKYSEQSKTPLVSELLIYADSEISR